MKNYWIQTEAPVATWLIDVGPALAAPGALVELARVMTAIGRESGLLLTPAGDDASSPPGPLDVAQALSAADWTLALCRGRGWDDAEATMSWYASDGELVEGPVADLGTLLKSLEPVPASIPSGLMTVGEAPLALHGPRLKYVRDTCRLEGAPLSTTISISTYSDIWFPFLVGAAHPWADFDRRFDNRELAGRHTPRLNRFLADARRAGAAAGCLWRVEPTECNTLYAGWIQPDGVVLDGPAPALMPAGAAEVEWPPL